MFHRTIASLFAICLLGLGIGTQAFAHGVAMKLRHALPADSYFHTRFILPWVAKVQQESGGRLHFDVQAGDGAPERLFDQVKEGGVDLVWTALCHTPGRFLSLEVFELPLLTKSVDGTDRAMWEYLRLSDAAQTELEGVRVLALHASGAPLFHMRGRAIDGPQDLKGLTIAAPTSAGRRLLTAAGAASPDLPATQIAAALANGTVDGALLPWEAVLPSGLDATVKFHSQPASPQIRLGAPVFMLAMNAAAYRLLPDDLKKIIQANSGPEVAAQAEKALEASAAAERKAATERGDAINVMPAADATLWQKPAASAIDAWVKTADERGASGKELVDAAKDALEAAQK